MRKYRLIAGLTLCVACTAETDEPRPQPLVAATSQALHAERTRPLPTLTWDELGVLGRDAGYSAYFGDVSAWAFGDTFSERPTADKSMLSNTWSWTADRRASDGIGPFQQATDSNGAPLPLLPYDSAGYERAYNAFHRCEPGTEKLLEDCPCAAGDDQCGDRFALWPGAVVAYRDNHDVDRGLLLYTELYVHPGELRYTIRGTSIARWDDPRKPAQRTAIALFGPDDPDMNAGAVAYTTRDGDFLYVYSCEPNMNLTADCIVGRAPFVREGEDALAAILNRASWRFFTGGDPDAASSWDASHARAAIVLEASTTFSLQHNGYLDALTAVYSQFLTHDIFLQTATRPEGPWSGHPSAPLFDVGEIQKKPDYYGLQHAEFDRSNGKYIYITTSHPDPANEFVMPTRLFEVKLLR